MMKKIAVLTMARNDDFFLSRWIAYYGEQFGQKNLYVYLDGLDQTPPPGAGQANVKAVAKLGTEVVDAENQRLNFLSDRAAELLKKYDIVIGVDADEFLAVDPNTNKSLAEYLSDASFKTSLSPLGLDVAQHKLYEKSFDAKRPFLQQRGFALIHSRFTKASIINRPIRWGRGFHRVRGHNFHIDKNLYLFHLGNYNLDSVLEKMNHPDIIARKEVKHYKRNRLRIFNVISDKKALDGDKVFGISRLIQTLFRPPHKWNTPSMLGLNLVVRIPKRFAKIV